MKAVEAAKPGLQTTPEIAVWKYPGAALALAALVALLGFPAFRVPAHPLS